MDLCLFWNKLFFYIIENRHTHTQGHPEDNTATFYFYLDQNCRSMLF